MGKARNQQSQSHCSLPTPFPPQELIGMELDLDHFPDTSSKLHQLADPVARANTKDSTDRDAVLARVESEKRLALIKAWEDSQKTKVENK